MLSDSESEVESIHHLTINEHYAKAFEYKKEREELQKLKDKYGSDFEEGEEDFATDSESDESEDEDGEELTPTVDAAIFRTLARIKRKDPQIYDAKKGIFSEEQTKVTPMQTPRVSKNKSKPVTVRQAALESALNPDSRSPSPEPVPHAEEQRALRVETIAAFHQAMDDQDNDDGLFVPREKTKDEQEREEEEYKTFLEREVGEDLRTLVSVDVNDENSTHHEAEEAKKKQRSQKTNLPTTDKDRSHRSSKQASDQEFLMSYIMNRGWIDRSSNHVPTYGEVLSSQSKGKGKAMQEALDMESRPIQSDDEEVLPTADPELDDDDFEEIVDRFESSYNFRFEEPDAAVIKTHPRNLPSLVRREDTSRKEARERRKQRKEEELMKKREEVKLLKKLKMKAINAKLERIGREGGKTLNDNPALRSLDLDSEWDPNVHDRQMADLYDNDADVDNEKPNWDEDIDIDDIIPGRVESSQKKKKKKKKKKKDGEDEGESGVDIDVMDADVDRVDDDDEWDGTEEMRKKKVDEYMDEIYGLDFNDMVGDLPTRFKYVPVQPQTYSLTPVEILMATDQELNEYMSVKKYAPYRKEVKWDSKRVERLKEFKKKVLKRTPMSVAGEGDGDNITDKSTKKRKGKKERLKLKAAAADGDGEMGTTTSDPSPTEDQDKLKRKREDGADDVLTGNAPQSESHRKKKRRRKKQPEAGEG